MLAQTFTAGVSAVQSITMTEIMVVVIPLLSALIAVWTGKKVLNLKTMFNAAAVGFKAALDSLPPAKAEEIKESVKAEVIEAGGEALNEAMKAIVRKVTQKPAAPKEEPSASDNRPDGLPKLVLLPLIFALSLAGGCVNAGIHDNAIAMQESTKALEVSADKLKRSSVPNPAYGDAEKDAWVLLWTKHQKAITEIQKAVRAIEEGSR